MRSGIAVVSVCVLLGLVAFFAGAHAQVTTPFRLRPQRPRQQPPRFQLLRRAPLPAREVASPKMPVRLGINARRIPESATKLSGRAALLCQRVEGNAFHVRC